MYHISLGQYKINNDEILPTQNLDGGFDLLFDYEENTLYSLLLIDEGSLEYLDSLDKSQKEIDITPYIHLFITNISNGEVYIPDNYSSYQDFHIVEHYEKPSKYKSPHLFYLYLYKQDCDRSYPLIQRRENFDLEKLIQREKSKGCFLSLVNKISFYAVADPSSIDSDKNKTEDFYNISGRDRTESVKEKKRKFEDLYSNTEDWDDTDYAIVAKSVFGILNSEELSKEEIKNTILKFFN